MIKINLLGVAAPPTAVGGAPPPTRAFQVWTFVGTLVACFAIVGLFYKIWSGAVANLELELKKQKAEQARLAAIKAENDGYQRKLQQLEQRINTIQMLQARRVGPVEMMTALGNVVNRTNDLFLYSVVPQGERLVVRGQSSSVESMATLLDSIHRSGYFDDVQLRQFFQDDQQNRLTYKFVLDCIYRSPTEAVPGMQPAGAPGSAAPARRTGK